MSCRCRVSMQTALHRPRTGIANGLDDFYVKFFVRNTTAWTSYEYNKNILKNFNVIEAVAPGEIWRFDVAMCKQSYQLRATQLCRYTRRWVYLSIMSVVGLSYFCRGNNGQYFNGERNDKKKKEKTNISPTLKYAHCTERWQDVYTTCGELTISIRRCSCIMYMLRW